MDSPYAIEMLNITKRFPGIIANDNITLQLKKGEIHALLGENGAGKSTLMSVLFGLYQAEEGTIKKDGKVVQIRNPNDANDLGIGMVHQHFKLVECFTVLDNIILGVEPNKAGAHQQVVAPPRLMPQQQAGKGEVTPLQALTTAIPVQALPMLPYVITLAALLITSGRSREPESLAKPYIRGGR